MPQQARPVQQPPAPGKTQAVEITDDTIRLMLHDTRFLNSFPFLKRAKDQQTKHNNCGCGSARQKTSAPNMAALRRNIANMPAVKKVRLKQLLQASQVTVKYPKSEGGTVVKKF